MLFNELLCGILLPFIQDSSCEVPMKIAFCQQIDSKQFRSEAQGNTNEALLMLYQQFMEMPDGPQKRHFLESVSDVLLEILQRQLLTLSLEAYENSSLRSFFQNMYFLFNVLVVP